MRVLILTGGAVEEKFAADYIKQWNPDVEGRKPEHTEDVPGYYNDR